MTQFPAISVLKGLKNFSVEIDISALSQKEPVINPLSISKGIREILSRSGFATVVDAPKALLRCHVEIIEVMAWGFAYHIDLSVLTTLPGFTELFIVWHNFIYGSTDASALRRTVEEAAVGLARPLAECLKQ